MTPVRAFWRARSAGIGGPSTLHRVGGGCGMAGGSVHRAATTAQRGDTIVVIVARRRYKLGP